MKNVSLFLFVFLIFNFATKSALADDKVKWYDKLSIRGYSQFRYSRLLESNSNMQFSTDKSIGNNGGFLIRRARLILSGDVSDNIFMYMQSDFSNTISDSMHVPQIRDWYADIYLDNDKEFRLRIGQSKIPYGFENMQSSQNRIAIERTDALNTGVPGERDIGLFGYWATDEIRKRFKYLVDSGLKGSGDYGIIGIGVYNGQGINIKEKNNSLHVVGHIAYPFNISDQFVEMGVHGYTGKTNIEIGNNIKGNANQLDTRLAANFVLYPNPIGFQAEYNIGKGPELYNNEILNKNLHGGYLMANVKINDIIPYVRIAQYDGGRKNELNSPNNKIKELESGVEIKFNKYCELTYAFNLSEREINYKSNNGYVNRLQLQINY